MRLNMVDHLTAIPTQAKEIGRTTGGIKTRMWIKLPVSFWALLEQIRTDPSHPAFSENASEAVDDSIGYCIMAKARELGLETG